MIHAADATATDERTPLLPHPAKDRPVFSQDRYRRDELPPPPPPEPTPTFTQDRFDLKKVEDHSGQLRKVPYQGRELSEVEIAKGVVQLNVSQYDLAERHFKAALAKDPRNFVALEYLAAVQEGRGDLNQALAWLVKAKHRAPRGRWGMLNFQLGRIYFLLRNYGRAEVYLRLALAEGGHETATRYTLGYLLYTQERYLEAHEHLYAAKVNALRPAARDAERNLLQPIHYYLGEVYSRLGFTRYAIVNLRETEVGDSWEVRNTAWRVHSELNHSESRLTLGNFLQYDSNVILLPQNASLPLELTTQAAFGNVLTVDGGWQSSPAKKWSFGFDGNLYLNNHVDSTLAAFDVLYLGAGAWLNGWNRKDWSFTGRYEVSHALVDRASFTTFQNMHGPGLSVNYFPFQRWNWELSSYFRFNSFADDLTTGPNRRSGTTFGFSLRGSLKAPNPKLRPSAGYTFEMDEAQGDNFDTRVHSFFGELKWRAWTKTHLIGGVTLSKIDYPFHLTGRSDTNLRIRVGLNHLLNQRWMFLFDVVQLDNNSDALEFDYSRVTVTSGVTYTF